MLESVWEIPKYNMRESVRQIPVNVTWEEVSDKKCMISIYTNGSDSNAIF